MESVSTHSRLTQTVCGGDPPYHGVLLIDEEQRELLRRDATVSKIHLLSDQDEREVSCMLEPCQGWINPGPGRKTGLTQPPKH